MKPVLLLSDLHLSALRPATAQAFHTLMRGPALDASAVYILGDLFDWWIGDEQLDEPFAGGVGESIRAVTERGIPVFFTRGNRDFLIGEHFERRTGARILPEQHVVDLGGTPTLLLHGDELCTDDVEYQRYRARMRSPDTMRRLLALPYLVRRFIAWYLRRKSRDATALKAELIMDVSVSAVDEAFRRHAVARMIHGHTHRPARHTHTVDGTARERFVLADWHDRGRYIKVDDTGVHDCEIDRHSR